MFRNNAGAASLLRTRTRKAKKLILSYGTILFMIFSVFLIASLYLMRQNILSNSNTVGYEVVQRLDSSLQVEFQKQKQFVEFIAHYADVFLQDHADDPDGGRAAFDLWMKKTEAELQAKQKDLRIDIYASIDGQIVSPTYWDGDAFLITEARPWYKAAMAAEPGKAAILDPYTDIFTNTVITTVSARIGNTNNVFAIDLYLESASQSSTFAYLVSENYCFYLVDSKGTVILYYTPFNANYSQIQRYVSSFFETNVKQHISGTEEPITDLMGDKRNVYSIYNPETGWYTIATTLYSDILFNYHMISNLFLLMVVIFIIIEVWMVWREYHLSSQIETTNEALKVLGNSYQIILRVNFKMGTFTTLKAPDNMRIRLASRNNFDDLLTVFSDMVLPESWNNFYKNFSLNHLRNLASLSIRDFGHDYQLKLSNDNNYKWFNARILFDESLDLDESILCFKLIDDEKITEIEEHKLLADALESAKKNEESKNVFFANMSHDMRTPLNGIIGLCQIGINHLRQSDTANLPDVFKKMTTASHQLLALVDDILEVARPQMENKLTLEPFDIVRAVKENIDVFKVNAASQGKEVNLTCDVKHSVVIGDTAKLRQILNNLVSNSLKYSHRGCVVNISIREILHLHKPSFMIEVADTGIGMDKNFLAKLFAPYARELRLNSVQGTGLGMSIVKNVVSIMGGDIRVKSAVNVGTTFTINIPFKLADEETAHRIQSAYENDFAFSQGQENISTDSNLIANNADAQEQASTSAPTKNSESSDNPLANAVLNNFKLDGLHILIVEDNQLNMEIACDILGMKGVTLTSAWDGEQAVDIFNKSPEYSFDVILMDMRMPNMDGCEASSQIRASGKADATTIPIIACTANAFTEDIAATQSAGMNAHVSKPLDFNVLENVMGKLIANRTDLATLVQKHKYLLGTEDLPPSTIESMAQSSGSSSSSTSTSNTANSSSTAASDSESASASAGTSASAPASDNTSDSKSSSAATPAPASSNTSAADTASTAASESTSASDNTAPSEVSSTGANAGADANVGAGADVNTSAELGASKEDPKPILNEVNLSDTQDASQESKDNNDKGGKFENARSELVSTNDDSKDSVNQLKAALQSNYLDANKDQTTAKMAINKAISKLTENKSLAENNNKPPVVPVTSGSHTASKEDTEGQKQDNLGKFKASESGSFVENYKASKELQAAVEPNTPKKPASVKPNNDEPVDNKATQAQQSLAEDNDPNEKFSKELLASKSNFKMKIKSSTEDSNPDYSYLKEKSSYSLFKRKNKEKTDARSLLDGKQNK